jgi:hypothetical protein
MRSLRRGLVVLRGLCDNLFIEVWQDIETGDVTYSRTASLDDQSHHGRSLR